jgi:hypothetical protein
MGSFSVSVSEGEDELVKGSSSPDDQDEEDGLFVSRVKGFLNDGTYEVFKDSEKDFFLGRGPVSSYSSVFSWTI